MEFLKNIAKGAVIGISNIIPGVSGGTMAVAMGIYDKLIHCITNIFKEFKKSFLFLLPILIGMAIALGAGALGLNFLFEKFPIPTNLLFIGLILGGLPAVFKKVKGNKVKFGYILMLLIFFVLVVGLAVIGEREGKAADLNFNFLNVLKLFGIGVIASATMVIPGVSGSMVLLLLGYYNPIVAQISDFIHAALEFDVNGVLISCGVLVPFGIGVIVGIVGIAKAVEIVFKKFPLYAFWGIIGLIVASPIAIVLMNLSVFQTVSVPMVIAGVITLGAGFFVAMKLGE